jgi:hypothetical protein
VIARRVDRLAWWYAPAAGLVLALFRFDLGLCCLGVLVKLTALLGVVAAGLWCFGRSVGSVLSRVDPATYPSTRDAPFLSGLVVVVMCASGLALTFATPLPHYSFVWRRLGYLESQLAKAPSPEGAGPRRWARETEFSYPMCDTLSNTYHIVFEHREAGEGDGIDRGWEKLERDSCSLWRWPGFYRQGAIRLWGGWLAYVRP